MSASAFDLLERALLAALPDGKITIDDFPEWNQFKAQFKRRVNRERRRFLAQIEDQGLEVSQDDALLALALLRLLRGSQE